MKSAKSLFFAWVAMFLLTDVPEIGKSWAAGPAVSGFVDTTYNWNAEPGVNVLRSYDGTANTFQLNAAHLAFDGGTSPASYHVELDFGTDAAVNVVTDPNRPADAVDVQEAYLTWMHGSHNVTAGKFVTLEGIEVIESGVNPTISRGYLFGLAEPFTHVGVKVTQQMTDKLDGTLGVVNGWDRLTDTNREKTWLARLGVNLGDPLSFGLVGYYGAEAPATNNHAQQFSLDLTGVSKWGNLALNFQANYGGQEASTAAGLPKAHWSGFGIQPVYTVSPTFAIGGRVEYFDDRNGFRTGLVSPSPSVYNLTVTPSWKLADAVTFRSEYRYDKANGKIFAGTKDNSNTVSAEMIYTF